ncbi:MAG: type II toxin-antitoxin system RelE/ParE family toxin [Acidobacteriota bacterium]|jgi:putative addiction module killer protein|nr:type II toxin-antitoxin system RelE/ParE family toxin [Acidobacteriota bacterium]
MEYEVVQTEEFKKWRENLRDRQAANRIQARIDRVVSGNFGDWKTETGEVKAMRIDYGPGYRLYYVIRGSKVVFLLCGGDKRTQNTDLKRAYELSREV